MNQTIYCSKQNNSTDARNNGTWKGCSHVGMMEGEKKTFDIRMKISISCM